MLPWERLRVERLQRLRDEQWHELVSRPALPSLRLEAVDSAPEALKWRLRQPPLTPDLLVELFTPEQLVSLVTLRQQAEALQVSEESGLDAHRLLFARWLVERGRLSEDV